MNVGDKVMVDGRAGVVRVADPLNGEIVVELVDAGGAPYYANVAVEKLSPVRETAPITTPWGTGYVERPVDGETETRAVWETQR
jgi:hypothetical protein